MQSPDAFVSIALLNQHFNNLSLLGYMDQIYRAVSSNNIETGEHL